MTRKKAGFTLIELVVTLSVIGILAALKIPRYIALQTQAPAAKVKATFGGVLSAAALAHAQVLATNAVTSGAATITMEGVGVNVVNGYPTANAVGIVTATQMNPVADEITLSGGGTQRRGFADDRHQWRYSRHRTVTYQALMAASTAPAIGSDTSGC